jgi:MoaA/NifB/PqqE/SkfB family radical SAM enzyme
MVQYLPWSKETLQDSLEAEKAGRIPALDLELTAKCSAASCIYCDSMPEVRANPTVKELLVEPTLAVLEQARERGLKWIYTCGLGEPLEDQRFSVILDFMKEHGIKMSLFTNGQFIKNLEIAKRLKASNVHIILKMDTFNAEEFDTILGGVAGRAKKIYQAIDYLLNAGYTNTGYEGYTDLAFSVVPTTISKDTISEVVEYCLKNNIFPSVGELEQAGNVITHNLFESLGLSEDCLKWVKKDAELAEMNYMRPICPAILTGLHIDNQGNCIVDEVTGLNCKWFLLSDPRTKIIGNVVEQSITELYNMVKKYRVDCWEQNRITINGYEKIDYVFGGCGGNPSEIIRLYKETYSIT